MSCDNNVSVYEELFTIFLRRGLIANSSAMLLDESRSIVFTGIPRQLYMEGEKERERESSTTNIKITYK